MMDWISMINIDPNESYIILQDQFQQMLWIYGLKRIPFEINEITTIQFDCCEPVLSFYCFLYDESSLLLLIQSSSLISYAWVSLNQLRNLKSLTFLEFLKKDDPSTDNHYLLSYRENEKIVLVCNNFAIITSERIENPLKPIVSNPKKFLFVTEIGNMNNLIDIDWERIISLSHSKISNDSVILSSSIVSNLPAAYWVQWDFQQSKVKVLWKRCFFQRNVQAIFASSVSRDVSSVNDLVVLHNERTISLMNPIGVIFEHSSLPLGPIASLVFWEYKNNIITLFISTMNHEFYLAQIEPPLQFSLRIVQQYTAYGFTTCMDSILRNKLIEANMILSTPPAQNQRAVIFLALNHRHGWEMYTNDAAVEEYGYPLLKKTVQALPQRVFISETYQRLTSNALLTGAASNNDGNHLLLKLKGGFKLAPLFFCSLDLFRESIPDLSLVAVRSIDSLKMTTFGAKKKANSATVYLLLSSRLCALTSILQVLWSSVEGFHAVQPILDASEIIHGDLLDIYQIKQSNYFLFVCCDKLVLLSASPSAPSNPTLLYQYSLIEIIQIYLSNRSSGAEDDPLSSYLASSPLESYHRIERVEYLYDNVLVVKCQEALLHLSLNLSQILNKSSFIGSITGILAPRSSKIHFDVNATLSTEKLFLQASSFNHGILEVECSAFQLIGEKTTHFSKKITPRTASFHPATLSNQITAINILQLSSSPFTENTLYGLLFCTDQYECCWLVLSAGKDSCLLQEEFYHTGTFSGDCFINKIFVAHQTEAVIEFWLVPHSYQFYWKRVIIESNQKKSTIGNTNPAMEFVMHEIEEIFFTNSFHLEFNPATGTQSTHFSSLFPCSCNNLSPVYIPQIENVICIEALHAPKNNWSYNLISIDPSVLKERPRELTVEQIVRQDGKVLSLQYLEKWSLILVLSIVTKVISGNHNENNRNNDGDEEGQYELRIYRSNDLHLLQCTLLNEYFCPVMNRTFRDSIESMEITLFPTDPLLSIDHAVEGFNEDDKIDSDTNSHIYFHIAVITSSIYEVAEDEEEDPNSQLFHLISLSFQFPIPTSLNANLSQQLAFIHYLYFPFVASSPSSSRNIVTCTIRKEGASVSRNSSSKQEEGEEEGSSSYLIVADLHQQYLGILLSTGEMKVLGWKTHPAVEEIKIRNKIDGYAARNIPNMIGAHSMKKDSTTTITTVQSKRVTKMTIEVIASHAADPAKTIQSKRDIQNILVARAEESMFIIHVYSSNGIQLYRTEADSTEIIGQAIVSMEEYAFIEMDFLSSTSERFLFVPENVPKGWTNSASYFKHVMLFLLELPSSQEVERSHLSLSSDREKELSTPSLRIRITMLLPAVRNRDYLLRRRRIRRFSSDQEEVKVEEEKEELNLRSSSSNNSNSLIMSFSDFIQLTSLHFPSFAPLDLMEGKTAAILHRIKRNIEHFLENQLFIHDTYQLFPSEERMRQYFYGMIEFLQEKERVT